MALDERKKKRKKKKRRKAAKKKDDRCTRIAKRRYDVWPSAYASGAVVKCRQGKIWKNVKEGAEDGEHLEKKIRRALRDEGGAAGMDAGELAKQQARQAAIEAKYGAFAAMAQAPFAFMMEEEEPEKDGNDGYPFLHGGKHKF